MENSLTYCIFWSLLIWPVLGTPIPPPLLQRSLLNEMFSDPLMCLSHELLSSDYFKMCNIYISEHSFDPEPLLCVGIHDTALQLCELNKLLLENPIKIPQNKKELSDALDIFRSKQSNNFKSLKGFCAYAKNCIVGNNSHMSEKAKNLKIYFEDKCERLCGDLDEVKIHPLCEIIVWSIKMLSDNKPNGTQDVLSKSIFISNGELRSKDGHLTMDQRIRAEPNADDVLHNSEHVNAEKGLHYSSNIEVIPQSKPTNSAAIHLSKPISKTDFFESNGAEPNADYVSRNPEDVTAEKHYSSNIEVIPRSKPINSAAAFHFSKPISKINTFESNGAEPSIEATDNAKLGVGLETPKSEYKSDALTSNAETPLVESTDLLQEGLSLKNKSIEKGLATERQPKFQVEGNHSAITSASNSKNTMLETDVQKNTLSQFEIERKLHKQFDSGKVPQNSFDEDKNTFNNISDNKNMKKILDKSPNKDPKYNKNASTSHEKSPNQEQNISNNPDGFPEEHRGITVQILETENQPNPVTIDKPGSDTEKLITPTQVGKYPKPISVESVNVAIEEPHFPEPNPINENGFFRKPSEPKAVDDDFAKQNEEDQVFDDDDKQFILPEQESEQLNDLGNVDTLKAPRKDYVIKDPFVEAEDSHFFTYFMMMTVICIIGYLVFHSKRKLCALAVEGRRSRSTPRRRPNTASYSKLDCNLEEALTSNKSAASVTHVLY